MGMLVEGKWSENDGESRGIGGKFNHLPTFFRNSITADGSSGFKAEFGRYHIYATKSCPWAHRTLIFRHLKGLVEVIGLHLGVNADQGYRFDNEGPHRVPGSNKEITFLHELYSLADPNYTGRVTVPALWDAKQGTVVNNETSEIILQQSIGTAKIEFVSSDGTITVLKDDLSLKKGDVVDATMMSKKALRAFLKTQIKDSNLSLDSNLSYFGG